MARLRKIGTAVATFSVAMGIGFVMQNGDALASRFVEPQTGPVPMPVAHTPRVEVSLSLAPAPVAPETAAALAIPAAAQVAGALPVPADAASPALPAEMAAPVLASLTRPAGLNESPSGPPVLPAALETSPAPLALPDMTPPSVLPDACTVTLSAEVLPQALVSLSLDAPCHRSSAVTLHHEGLMFSVMTDADGKALLTAPALTADALFVADLGNGEGAVTSVQVPDVALIDRAVLQWRGDLPLNLHAFEFGATFGSPGHVWQASTGAPIGPGGFLMLLGDPASADPRLAQVYSYPSGQAGPSGEIDLMVEAEVTAATCGQVVTAQTIQMSAGGRPFSADLTLPMPGCDAVGGFVALPDMLLDVTLAQR